MEEREHEHDAQPKHGARHGTSRVGALGAGAQRCCCPRRRSPPTRRRRPTFTKDIAPIFQEKCEACHRPDSIAPMSLMTYAEARPWARSIKARVGDRQMPPWQIDETVGIQKFKNDRSLTDDQIDTIAPLGRRRRAAGRPERHAGRRRQWPDDQGWNFAALFGQKEPDLIIKSTTSRCRPCRRTRGTSASRRRASPSRAGCARSKSGPTTLKGRKITHHAIAYLEQTEPGAPAGARSADAVHGMGGRQAGRDDAPRHRQAAAARLQVPLGHPLLAGR